MASMQTTAKYTQSTLRAASVGMFVALRTALDVSDMLTAATGRVVREIERAAVRQAQRVDGWVLRAGERHPALFGQAKRTLGEHGIGLCVLTLAGATAWNVAFSEVPPLLAVLWIGTGALLGGIALSHRRRAQALTEQLATLAPQFAKAHQRWQRERTARRRGYVELLDVDALDERALAFVRDRCLAVARAAEAELETRQVFTFVEGEPGAR